MIQARNRFGIQRLVCRVQAKFSSAAEASTADIADRCNQNLVHSPFPPLPEKPLPPLYEFVSESWAPHGGCFDDNKVAIVDGSTGLTRTFADYHKTTGSLAATLKHDMDIHEGSTVAIFCPNHVDYLPVSLSVAICGAKLTPFNPQYTAKELETVLQRSSTSVFFVHVNKLETALEAVRNCPGVKHVVVITDEAGEAIPEGTIPLQALQDHSAPLHETVHTIKDKMHSHPYLLPYSSGTTGLPKGVCLTHSNIVSNLLQCEEVERTAFPHNYKLISPLPFFHMYAFSVSMLYCAWKGHTVITTSGRFDFEQYCQLVEEHAPERTHLVPPIILGLAKSPLVDKYNMSSLKTIMSAAAPLGTETEEEVKKRLQCEVKQGWGMSELSPIGTMNADESAKPGSVGPLVPSTVGKVIDEHGNSLGPHQPGELLIRGPQVMIGYLNEPDKTAECLSPSGWLRTGDMAIYDEDGYFYITDRIKELIKVRGFPVAPAELEALLLTHEAVNDVAVIGVKDEASGELPRAYVVLKQTPEAQQVTSQELYAWVKERVAAFKRLDGGVIVTETIPKSASGKILRRILREQTKAEEQKS